MIEFPLEPHVDRIFAYMSAALGLDYWLFPQIASHQLTTFNAEQADAEALVALVKQILTSKGIKHGHDEL